MDLILKQSNNSIIIETEYGNTIKIVFSENDNIEIVDTALNNLMTTYEKRISA